MKQQTKPLILVMESSIDSIEILAESRVSISSAEILRENPKDSYAHDTSEDSLQVLISQSSRQFKEPQKVLRGRLWDLMVSPSIQPDDILYLRVTAGSDKFTYKVVL